MGKVEKVVKSDGSMLLFAYNAQGNRIRKISKPATSTTAQYELYVYDATGNMLATYSGAIENFNEESVTNVEVELENHYIYGSQRIGVNKNTDKTKMNRHNIQYELTNHLGNVMVTISGAKIQTTTGNYEPEILSTTTYGSFGNEIEEWSFNSSEYKFAFNGKENIEEIDGWQDYGMRMYNRLIGRFPSPDPLIVYKQQYPELSSYQFASNTPIAAIDLDGLEAEIRVWNMDRGTYISHQVPKEKQIGDGILNLYYRTNNKGEYKLYSVWYIQSWTEWWENSGSKTRPLYVKLPNIRIINKAR